MESQDSLPSLDVLKVKIIEESERRNQQEENGDANQQAFVVRPNAEMKHGNNNNNKFKCYNCNALLADLQESVYCQSQGFDLETTPNKQTKGEQCFCEKSEYGIFNGRSIVTGPHCFTKNERGPFPLPINSDKRNNRKAILQSFSNQSSDFLSRPFNFNLSSSQLLNNQILKRGNSLSELDSLLLDLNSARYNFENKKDYAIISNIEEKPSRNRIEMAVEKTFGDEEENISEHITSNMSSHKFPTFGQQVTVTVGEIKTENRQVEDSVCSVNGNNQKMYTYPSKDSYSATKELDDLMASLSDIKFNSGSHHHQTVTDYAELNKGISQLTKAATDSSTFKKDSRVDRLDSMLGNLQANMSRQGVNTIQKGCCFACEKPIVGQVITALEKTWHPEHFTCHHCNQELGTRNFFERDGFPYCELDYHSLFSPRCAYCNGAILDKCVTALDKTWHTEHFFCTQCGQQFGEDGFHEREGKPYCRNDYFEMFAPKCNGCNRAIMENYISALNSQWHPDCFVCRDCKKAVRGKSFYAMEGKPVCPTCVGVEEEE